LTKAPLIYSVSCFNLGVLELALLGGLSPPKLLLGDEAGFRFRTGVTKLSLTMYSVKKLLWQKGCGK